MLWFSWYFLKYPIFIQYVIIFEEGYICSLAVQVGILDLAHIRNLMERQAQSNRQPVPSQEEYRMGMVSQGAVETGRVQVCCLFLERLQIL